MTPVILNDLGRVDYKEAWDHQQKVFDSTCERKMTNRSLDPADVIPTDNHLLLCEHQPVITLGRNADRQNLLMDPANGKIDVYDINRGGDITFHGPGQLVAYPILDLDHFFTDIGLYLRKLEEVVIHVLKTYEIESSRLPGATGVWLEPESPSRARKICAIGIRCSRWVTMHGLAFNINTDLDYFKNIIPCGITDKQVTSLQKEMGEPVDFEEAKTKFLTAFKEVFKIEYN